MSVIELGVRVAFVPVGLVLLDESTRLRFPALPAAPAVYRITLTGAGQDRAYIGETDNVRRRGQNYRTPGPSQRTSLRIHGSLQQHLAASGTVAVDIATTADVIRNGAVQPLDLTRKSSRVLAEHVALVATTLDGKSVLNL